MKNKVKYLKFGHQYSKEELLEDFKIVDKPLDWKHTPNGEYIIRGNKKSHHKEYWVVDNEWFFVSEQEKENGHYNVSCTTYRYFPVIKHSEYVEMNNHYDRLNKLWKRNVYGYFFWLELREMRRGVKKRLLDLNKEANNTCDTCGKIIPFTFCSKCGNLKKL